MKNRKKFIAMFLVVAIVCIGVGYAVITDNLTMNGTVKLAGNDVADFDKDIYWVDTLQNISHSNPNVSTSEADAPEAPTVELRDANDTMILTIPTGHLLAQGDTMTFTARIHNANTTVPAYVKLTKAEVTNNANSSDPMITMSIGDWAINGYKTIAANGYADVTITLTLKKNPTGTVDSPTLRTFELAFEATDTNPNP